jgi:hypothetical protein
LHWKNQNNSSEESISLKATKEIPITERFSLPLFVQAVASPSSDKTYLIAGLSIGF